MRPVDEIQELAERDPTRYELRVLLDEHLALEGSCCLLRSEKPTSAVSFAIWPDPDGYVCFPLAAGKLAHGHGRLHLAFLWEVYFLNPAALAKV